VRSGRGDRRAHSRQRPARSSNNNSTPGRRDASLLEAAALAGDEFTGALAAAALADDRQAIEARCAALQRAGGWIRSAGSDALADGTPSDRYRFVHPLHRAVLADRVPAARRPRASDGSANGSSAARDAPARVATALAHHFEAGRDADRAVRYRSCRAHRHGAARASRSGRRADARAGAGRAPARRRPRRDRRELLEQRARQRARAATSTPRSRTSPRSSRPRGTPARFDEEVQALLALSTAWSLRERARGLALAADAVARSADAAPALQHRARGVHAYWWARQHGGAPPKRTRRRRRSRRCAPAATPRARRAPRHARLFLQPARRLRRGASGGREALTLARDGGTALLAQWQRCWALMHLGAWEALLAALSDARRMAERDGHRLWALVFEQVVAWTLANAGAAGDARARADAARAAARAAGHEFGIALGAVVSGLAALEDSDLDAAAAALAEARASADRDPAAMEWMLRAPLHLGCAAVALARDDPAGAAAEADAAARLAAQAGEPTYTALAAALRARVAHARGDRAASRRPSPPRATPRAMRVRSPRHASRPSRRRWARGRRPIRTRRCATR
jgi:hypothetical protein